MTAFARRLIFARCADQRRPGLAHAPRVLLGVGCIVLVTLGCGTVSGPARPSATTPPEPFGPSHTNVLDAYRRGEGLAALTFYETTAAALDREGKSQEAGRWYTAAVIASARLGRYQQCITHGTRALELLLPNVQANAGTLNNTYANLATCHRTLGNVGGARLTAEGGLAIVRWLRPEWVPDYARAVLTAGLARDAFTQNDLDAALRSAVEAAKIFEELAARTTGAARLSPANLRNTARHASNARLLAGDVHLVRGELEAAEEAYQRGLQWAQSGSILEMEARALVSLGRLAYARRDYQRSLRELEAARAIRTRLADRGALPYTYQQIARAHAALGQTREALNAAERAIELLEEVRSDLREADTRTLYLETKQAIYQLAVTLALEQGLTESAFALAERSRARAFLDLLGSGAAPSKPAARALTEEEGRLRIAIDELRARLAEEAEGVAPGKSAVWHDLAAAEERYRAFLRRLRAEHPEQAALISVDPVSVREIQRLLPERTTLLEYLVTSAEIITWIVSRDEVLVHRERVPRSEVVKAIADLRQAITGLEPVSQIEHHGRELYDRLLMPVRKKIRADRLVIVPHDALHYLPFATLRSTDGRWLVEDFALTTLPSASTLKYLDAKRAPMADSALAVGNPTVSSTPELRWAEREAQVVGRRFPSATVLVRHHATKARVKDLSPSNGLIHFATHGELSEADPMRSALLLASGDGDNGRLEVRELFELDLHAWLVVLSACDTGMGKLSRGDELVGLQRAFLHAGSTSVIATLWKVDDRLSYELVRSFYDKLEDRDAPSALALAQRAAIAQAIHPFGWAGFGVSGKPK